jgi:mycothiol system anti-sigma-R factor
MSLYNFAQKTCEKIGRYLDSYLNDELLAETTHEVLKHVETCRACSEVLAARTRMKTLLQKVVRQETAPAALRERIRRGIRESESKTKFTTVWRSK